jgi:DNA-binding transcriptional regulator YdaS (Cro superfamily)
MRKVPNPTQNQDRGRERHGFRGVPPPSDFSLAALPDDALLTGYQVGALIQVSTNTIQSWRRQPDHPLEWEALPNGLVRYRAGTLRAYLALGRRQQQQKRFTAQEKLIANGAPAEPKVAAAARQPAPGLERSVVLRRAIALFGSREKLARAAGVHVNSIWKVLHHHGAMGRKLALAIERATNGEVRAEELILGGAQRTPKPKTKRRIIARDELVEAAE